MIRIIIFCLTLFLTPLLFSQNMSKGDLIIGFSTGPNFANLLNSEAPQKMYIHASDQFPVIFPSSDLTKSPAYFDYQTSLINDHLTGISVGIQLEYFLNNNSSIKTGLFYEPKGIDLNHSNTKEGTLIYSSYSGTNYINGSIAEKMEIRIQNNYLTVPIVLRRYLFKNLNLFVEGGVYLGYLISSKVDYLKEKIVSNETEVLYQNAIWLDNWEDSKKEYTRKFDIGLSIGTGYAKNITDKIIFNAELQLNVGLLDIDSKYNNEYSVIPVVSGANFSNVAVRSTNYFGLNSNSKNINLQFTIGLGYKI